MTDSLEVRIPLRLVGPQGASTATDAAIDTGFTGELVVPADLAEAIGLVEADAHPAILADGSRVMVTVYDCAVAWDGEERHVRAHCMGDTVLVGVAMFIGYRVRFDVIHDGPVLVTELP